MARRLLVALAIAAALVVAAWIALPWLAEIALERVVGGMLDARVEIGHVDLALGKGEVQLLDTTLRRRDSGVELAGARRIVVDADWHALLRGSLEAERVAVDEPRLLLAWNAQGRSNWEDVPARRPNELEEPPPAFRVAVARLEMGAGLVHLVDEHAEGLPDLRLAVGGIVLEGADIARPEAGAALHWGLASATASDWHLGVTPAPGQPLDFSIRATAGPTASDGSLPIEVEIGRKGGGHLRVEGQAWTDPVGAQLRVRWEGMRSELLWPFLAVKRSSLESGRSRGDLEVAFTLDDVPERGLVVRGVVEHEHLALTLERGGERVLIAIPSIVARLAELRVPLPSSPTEPPPPIRLQWSRIEVNQPSVDATLSEGSPEPEAPKASGALEAPPAGVEVLVDALSLRRGRVRWHDPSLGPGHEQVVAPVDLEASSLRWPAPGFAKLDLRVGGLGAKPLRLQGTWPPGRADAELRATRIELPPWNALIEPRSGYSVSKGSLSVHTRFRLRGDAYEAPTDIVLHRLEATSEGDAFQKTFGMPLAVALPLLRDPSGNIRLHVPVRGSVQGGTEFELTQTVAGALREAILNALASAVASPLDLAGTLVRRVGDLFVLGIGETQFEPGQAELPVATKVALHSAVQLAMRTPNARLELVPEVVASDLEALGVAGRSSGVLEGIVAAGRTLLGGGRAVAPEQRAELDELAKRRVAAVAAFLCDEAGLPADRVVRTAWDGMAGEGAPRVLLRIELPAK